MKRALFLPAAIATLSAGVLAPQGSGAAAPATVSCGQTLTKSTTLANDLTDCPGNGLKIGAANITVDLNGHIIDGTNNAKGSAGIVNGDCGKDGQNCKGYANVTIQNGTITDFYSSGVGLFGAGGNVVRKLTIRDIGGGNKQGDICAGIFILRSTGSTITGNVVSSRLQAFQVNGMDVYESPNTRIQGNRFERNAGDGMAFFGSPGNRVIRNQLASNRRNGVHVNNGSDSVLVSGNRARGNRAAGIAVGAIRNARVVRNSASGNGEAGLLLFDLRDSLIRGNRATGNWDGIDLYAGQGGVAQYGGEHGSASNQVLANTVMKNKHAGLRVSGDGGKDVSGDNLIAGNIATGNGRAGGILVEGSAKANRLRGNTANGNAGHGIDAARGAIDGGGNRAHGNRRTPQCVGVSCK
jgi:parallel beta-helix repeat protein